MKVQGERILIFGDSLSHPGPDAGPEQFDITQGSNRISSAPGDYVASMLLENGAAAARLNARVGRSAVNFWAREDADRLFTADQTWQPTKVIVMLGTNDIGLDIARDEAALAQIRDVYKAIGVSEIWAVGPMTYVGLSQGLNDQSEAVLQTLQRVFGKDYTIDARELSVNMNRTDDGVHFTPASAQPTASAITQALLAANPKKRIYGGIAVAGLAIVIGAIALVAARKRKLGPLAMLIEPRIVGPVMMAHDAFWEKRRPGNAEAFRRAGYREVPCEDKPSKGFVHRCWEKKS